MTIFGKVGEKRGVSGLDLAIAIVESEWMGSCKNSEVRRPEVKEGRKSTYPTYRPSRRRAKVRVLPGLS